MATSYVKPLMARDNLSMEQKKAVLLQILERFSEAEAEERSLTWQQAVEGLEVNGKAISVANARGWFNSDWGQDVRREWLNLANDSAQITLIQKFPAMIRRMTNTVLEGPEANAIAAMGRLKPYFEAVGLGQLLPSASGSHINVLIQQFQGETAIRPNMGEVTDAEIRVLSVPTEAAPAVERPSSAEESVAVPVSADAETS